MTTETQSNENTTAQPIQIDGTKAKTSIFWLVAIAAMCCYSLRWYIGYPTAYFLIGAATAILDMLLVNAGFFRDKRGQRGRNVGERATVLITSWPGYYTIIAGNIVARWLAEATSESLGTKTSEKKIGFLVDIDGSLLGISVLILVVLVALKLNGVM